MKASPRSALAKALQIFLPACTAWLAVVGCQMPPEPTPSPSCVLRELIAADNRGDLDAIVSCYSEDAVLLPPDSPPVVGRSAIRRSYEAGFAMFELQVSLEETDFRRSGSLAYSHGYTRGAFLWRDGSPPTPFRDGYMMALERDTSGTWRVEALMWMPAPGSKTGAMNGPRSADGTAIDVFESRKR